MIALFGHKTGVVIFLTIEMITVPKKHPFFLIYCVTRVCEDKVHVSLFYYILIVITIILLHLI